MSINQEKNQKDLETIPENEQQHIDSLIASLRGKMEKDYAGTRMLRDAHPKMLGCVKAEFSVEADLPTELAQGVFAQAGVYQTWVRFSNASTDVQSDDKGDIRGIGIKLMGVEGEKLMPDDADSPNQDFLLISYDRFIARSVAEFDELVKGLVGSPIKLVWFLLTHPRVALLTLKSMKKVGSVLDLDYFSAVPYALGNQAVKYKLIPREPSKTEIPKNPGYNFLGEELASRLREQDVVFDFAVQVQQDEKSEPIDDPTVIWDESLSPCQKVATLTIFKQDHASDERQKFGDNLSYNPWRCLAEHRPLGGFGRARKQVYVALSALRHRRNGDPTPEPTADDEEWTRS